MQDVEKLLARIKLHAASSPPAVQRDLASMVATALSLRLEAVVGIKQAHAEEGMKKSQPAKP